MPGPLTLVLLALVAGSTVYCMLVVIAAQRYRAARPPAAGALPPVSILKPLHGLDLGLEENLRTFFTQDYPGFEMLLAVRNPDDPAIAAAERLRAEYPRVPARLIVTGEPPYANAKVFSLDHMVRAASHDLVVMSDSDIRVSPRLLRALAAEFADPGVGVVTCPYRAVPGGSFWSRLEAVGLNTAFLGGVLAARMLEGMKFALGPTIAARRQVIEQLGGWEAFSPYLAEDFVLGQRAAAAGHKVLLSRYVIEHHIGSQPLGANFRHRVRWARSTRRSRPAGYIGQVFTNPLPLAIMLWISAPTWWPMSAAAVLARAAAAVATAGWVLGDPLTLRRPWLLPLEDLLSFAFWLAGFFGNTVTWRGRQYYLHRDGRFELIARETAARTHMA